MKRAIEFVLLVAVLGIAPWLGAQVHLGDLSLTGTEGLGVGYAAQYGDLSSGHGLNWGSQTTINGSYYDPRFLNFSVVPYFNQSRANSDSASVSNATGITAVTNLFSGSRIPTSVNYAYSNDSLSNYNLGEQSFTTHGSSTTFGVSSSVSLWKIPTIGVMYQQGGSASELYGNNQEAFSHFHSFNLNTGYKLAGFRLHGGVGAHWGDSEIPNLFSEGSSNYDSSSRSYNVSATHNFPFHGGAGIGYDHETYSGSYTGGYNAGSFDLVNGNINMNPIQHLQISTDANFNDNLAGVLQQTITTTNGVIVINSDGHRSNSFLSSTVANYSGFNSIGLSGGYTYAQQEFAGGLYSSHALHGQISYSKRNLLGGMFNATFGVTENIRQINYRGYNVLASWSRRFGAWGVTAGGSYNRDTQTVLLAYTTTGYSFSGSVNRKLGSFSWSAAAATSKSKFNQLGDAASKAESLSSTLSAKRFSVGGTYTDSSGNSFLTSTGLASNTLPGDVLISPVLFGGHSYSVSGAVYPFRSLELNGSYVNARSSTLFEAVSSANTTSSTNLRLTWLFRKLSFTAGYTNFNQGFSASPTGPTSFSSFYFGLQRWFNFM